MATTIEGILTELREKTPPRNDGIPYLYRGEPQFYKKVSSKLYRDIEAYNKKIRDRHNDAAKLDAAIPNNHGYYKWADAIGSQSLSLDKELLLKVQKQELQIARDHIGDFVNVSHIVPSLSPSHPALTDYTEDDFGLLTEIQHLGGSTVLIDFTRNPDIALYFACSMPRDTSILKKRKKDDEFGRILILPQTNYDDIGVVNPNYRNNRILTQFSTFMLPRQGYIHDKLFSDVVKIPHQLMDEIREYLSKTKGITDAIMFNDIIGYVEFQKKREGFNSP